LPLGIRKNLIFAITKSIKHWATTKFNSAKMKRFCAFWQPLNFLPTKVSGNKVTWHDDNKIQWKEAAFVFQWLFIELG